MLSADKVHNKVEKALQRAAIAVMEQAKMDCPVDTGYLRNSITYEVDGNTATVYTDVDYAPYIEYGTGLYATWPTGRQTPWRYQDAKGQWHTTSGSQPHPFMGTALDKKKDEVMEIFKEALRD